MVLIQKLHLSHRERRQAVSHHPFKGTPQIIRTLHQAPLPNSITLHSGQTCPVQVLGLLGLSLLGTRAGAETHAATPLKDGVGPGGAQEAWQLRPHVDIASQVLPGCRMLGLSLPPLPAATASRVSVCVCARMHIPYTHRKNGSSLWGADATATLATLGHTQGLPSSQDKAQRQALSWTVQTSVCRREPGRREGEERQGEGRPEEWEDTEEGLTACPTTVPHVESWEPQGGGTTWNPQQRSPRPSAASTSGWEL